MNNPAVANAALLVGRIMLAAIFIQGGFNKIVGYAATSGYMESAGVPGILLPLVILTELGGGLLILVGWQTRIVAFLMAGFTLLAALLFHFKTGDRNQMIHFMKNIAIAGGFLSLVANGAGAWSVDGRKG
ncbi:MAG: DoxX family protein [Beijerinckiaceae bacterium]